MSLATLRQNIVGAWVPSLGANGPIVLDSSAYLKHAQISNANYGTIFSYENRLAAIDLDGINDIVSASVSYPMINGSQIASMSIWFKMKATNIGGCSFGIYDSTGGSDQFSIVSAGNQRTYVAFTQPVATNPNSGRFVLADTNWHQLVAVFDGSQSTNASRLRVYLDKVQRSLTFEGTIPSVLGTFDKMYMGGRSGGGQGRQDDMIVWNKKLSPTEVSLLYTIGRGGLFRQRRRFYSFGVKRFQAAWASQANAYLQPLGGVA